VFAVVGTVALLVLVPARVKRQSAG
jgi:hypothetical protein